ncbi:MAG: HEAT repeat domain-containing protein [Anaeromyxobacter sp.]
MGALTDSIRAGDIEAAWAEAARLGKGALPELLLLAGDASGDVRGLAVECMGATRAPEAGRPLVQALGDADAAVASTAANTLGTLATPELAPALVAGFARPSDWMVRRKVALLLARLDGWDPAALRAQVEHEPHAAVREAMVVALARRGEEEARVTFAGWLREAKPADSPRLVLHAELISQPWLLSPLTPLLDDWTPAVRLVEGIPGPQHLRVCDRVVDLVAGLSGQAFAGAPKPLTNYDLTVIDQVKAYLATVPPFPPVE